MNENGIFELKDFFQVIKKKIIFIALITLLFTGICSIILFFIIPPTYEADTSVVIGRPVSAESEEPYNYSEIEMYQQLTLTYSEIAKSTKVAQEAARRIGRGIDAQTVQKAVSISSVEDTQIISIKAKSSSAAEAAQIANTVADSLIAESKNIFNVGNIQVLGYAQVPAAPILPDKMLDMIICFIIGIIISTLIVFSREYMNKTFRSEKDAAEFLGLDILAVIQDS